MFYQGSLQDGITLAVREAKAVVCFVRDDTETSLQWEKDYFGSDEFAQSLETKGVILRLTAGSQEAGFLTSFCPITKFPAVVIIKNGSLREYLVPEVSEDEFRGRIMAAVDDSKQPEQNNMAPQTQHRAMPNAAGESTQPAPTGTEPAAPAPAPQVQRGHDTPISQKPAERKDESTRAGKRRVESVEEPKRDAQGSSVSSEKPQQQREERNRNTKAKQEKGKDAQRQKQTPAVHPTPSPERQPKPAPTLPRQYRLQVRLFDGSSIRSSFSPSQTIRKDVRSWLDEQMSESQPYNLTHILTPLPNHTLSIAEEDKTLEALGLGPSANLVMVPIQSYTEAYASAFSLPGRAVSGVYNMVYSTASSAASLVGSFLGYDQTPTPNEDHPSSPASSATNNNSGQRRPVASQGPVIRTLRDQVDGRDDRQLYNGNQLNFEPRRDSDG